MEGELTQETLDEVIGQVNEQISILDMAVELLTHFRGQLDPDREQGAEIEPFTLPLQDVDAEMAKPLMAFARTVGLEWTACTTAIVFHLTR